LGGGTATILAIIWHNDRVIGPRVRGVAFASAASVSKELAEFCTEFVTTVIYADDVVSRLSLRTVENLRHILVAMCTEEGRSQCFDADSISSLIEAYITAEKSTARRWRRHLCRIYDALTSVAAKHQSPFQMMYTGGSILCVIPEEDYILHPEKRPPQQSSRLIPKSTHIIKVRSVESFGEIVCDPAILTKHFPSNLKDFFRHSTPELSKVIVEKELIKSDRYISGDEDCKIFNEVVKVTTGSRSRSPRLSNKLSVDSFPEISLLKHPRNSKASILVSPRHQSMYGLFSCLHQPQVA